LKTARLSADKLRMKDHSQGKAVDKVLVDGMTFGGDPIAKQTRNLNASSISNRRRYMKKKSDDVG